MKAERSSRDPAAPPGELAGSTTWPRLEPAFALVRAWAGDGLEAIVLAGSHASGDAVWATVDGRPVSLSDLDVWAVMRDEPAARAAAVRARAGCVAAREALVGMGLAASLETGFVTRAGLAAMPAKPGTIELRRRGQVVWGDPTVMESVPDHAPADVSPEERQLLLENRAFELLAAWPAARASSALDRLLARHAVLKVAVDLATVEALAAGELPLGRTDRVAWALDHAAGPDAPRRRELGAAALAFAARPHEAAGPDGARREWRECARAWAATWARFAACPADGHEPWGDVLRNARRAPWVRRARRALTFEARSGAGPSRRDHLRHMLDGTPQHRVNASGVLLVLAAARSPGEPALPAGALRALTRLGVVPASARRSWDDARAAAFAAWDRWLHDGARTADAP
jgi:hypothetical protein